jgi:hypothetical protein
MFVEISIVGSNIFEILWKKNHQLFYTKKFGNEKK